jgi:hypothetical protein
VSGRSAHDTAEAHLSPVFRSMIALADSSSQRDSIQLTDTEMEESEIVKRALDIIYNVEFEFSSNQYCCDIVSLIIDFANKWEISMITNLIQKDLFMDAKGKDGPSYPSHCFLIALKLRRNELACIFLERGEKEGWFEEDFRYCQEITKIDPWKDASSRYLSEDLTYHLGGAHTQTANQARDPHWE